MEFSSDLAFNIFSGICIAATAIAGTFYALKQKNEDLKASYLDTQITKLIADVDKLKSDTVRVDYLKRIDEDMKLLRDSIQNTREDFVRKSDLREMEERLMDAMKSMEIKLEMGVEKKVDNAHCRMNHK